MLAIFKPCHLLTHCGAGRWQARKANLVNLTSQVSFRTLSQLQDESRRVVDCDGNVHLRIFGRVHLVAMPSVPTDDPDAPFAYFSAGKDVRYFSFCSDFGPMNLLMLHRFCHIIDIQVQRNAHRSTAMCIDLSSESQTNAVFLLGAYMIMRFDAAPEEAEIRFTQMRTRLIPFTDILGGTKGLDLHVGDCFRALWKAKQLGWVDFSSKGSFDPDEHEYLENPLNADLNEIVPGKFVVMRAPKELESDSMWEDHAERGVFSHRDFSPEYYVDILQQFDVQAVIRLDAPQYDKSVMELTGIPVADIPCDDDGHVPSPEAAAKFLLLAESIPGVLAVQGRTGLGRTATLIGLYLMKHYDFTAREAIAWMRLTRPGSVFGEQQHFLCRSEEVMRLAGAELRALGPQSPLSTDEDASGMIDIVLEAEVARDGGRCRLGDTRFGNLVTAEVMTAAAVDSAGAPRVCSPAASGAALRHVEAQAGAMDVAALIFRRHSLLALEAYKPAPAVSSAGAAATGAAANSAGAASAATVAGKVGPSHLGAPSDPAGVRRGSV